MGNLKEAQGSVYRIAPLGFASEEHKKLLGGYKTLTIYDQNNRSCGAIEYCWNTQGEYWEIESILVGKGLKRKGLGKTLLEAFCQEVGHNQPVHAVVTHESTLSVLRKKYSNMMSPGQSLLIIGEDLKDVPIVKFLESGGIRVDRMTFAKDKIGRYYSHNVRLWGITK